MSFNPLGSEADAFRVLLWVIGAAAVIIAVVVVIKNV
jgi:hypothetical protein